MTSGMTMIDSCASYSERSRCCESFALHADTVMIFKEHVLTQQCKFSDIGESKPCFLHVTNNTTTLTAHTCNMLLNASRCHNAELNLVPLQTSFHQHESSCHENACLIENMHHEV